MALLKNEIKSQEEEVLSGVLLASPDLNREFSRAIGYIQGLKYIEELLTKDEVNYDEDLTETLLGKDFN